MATSIYTNFNTKQTCSICEDVGEGEREDEVPLVITAQSRVGHPVQHLCTPESPGCPSPALIHWHWWKRGCRWLLEGSSSSCSSGQPCWETQPAEGHNLPLPLTKARGGELGWLDLWFALVWGACVPCVASGTAAVTASAGDVCWGEEIWLPEGEMTLITCSQSFKWYLAE